MLRWDWNKKIGKVKYEDGREDNLYQGNAQLIAIHENEDNTYYLSWFSTDKDHLRNMLGLNKGCEGCISENRLFSITEISLDTENKETAKIISDFAKAKIKIRINLYNSKSEECK